MLLLLCASQPSEAIGHLSEIVDRSGTTEYSRDPFGQVTRKRQSLVSGLVQQVSYTYTPGSQIANITYPSGSVLTHLYDNTGRLIQMNWNGAPLIANLAWNPMGQPTGWRWAFASPGVPGLTASRAYNTAAQLTATEFSTYLYDPAGRINNVRQRLYRPADTNPANTTIALGETSWGVTYDPAGRITGFNALNNGATFRYDANGNRANSTRTSNGQTTSRTYAIEGNSNKLMGFTQTRGGATTNVAYGYNANGDLTHDGLRTFSYNAEGRLSAVTTGATDASPTTRYAHNALGQRVFKTEPLYPPRQGDETDPGFFQSLLAFFTKLWESSASDNEKLGFAFVYDEEGSLIAETGTGGANSTGTTQHIYLPTSTGPMPIALIVNGEKFAVHSDHLNTPRRMTNASGQAVWQWSYSAFGDEKPTIAKNRFANLDINPNPGTTNLSEVVNNKRFDGQYFDVESGLFYNYFRSYSAERGRYTQGDPIGLRGGWSRFGYVDANPLSYTDPYGLNPRGFPRRPTDVLPFEAGGGGGGSVFPRGGPLRDPRTADYTPVPGAVGPHTTLGTRSGRSGDYTQGATFDGAGRFTGRTDVTNHGRRDHTDPHFHPATGPNSVGPPQACLK